MRTAVALVGVGYWGSNLLRVFGSLEDCRVAAVCDSDARKRAQIARVHPELQVTGDYESVLSDPAVDAVVLALPTELHHASALAALKAGKHCFVEKPMTTSVTEAHELIAAAKAADRRLMVGHTFEYHPAVRWIRDYIRKGELGDLLHVFSQRMNLGQIRSDVNALWNLAPHDISMVHYWLEGEGPLRVAARAHSFLQPDRRIADMGWMTMEFAGGTVADIQVSWLCPEKLRKTMIVGSKRMIIFDDVNVEAKLQVYDKGVFRADGPPVDVTGYGEFQLAVRHGDLLIPHLPWVEPLKVEAAHFVACIREGREPLSSGLSGLRVVSVLEAADLSIAQDGRPVALSELGRLAAE